MDYSIITFNCTNNNTLNVIDNVNNHNDDTITILFNVILMSFLIMYTLSLSIS